MQKYSAEEIHFNLMAIVSDRKKLFLREIDNLNIRKTQVLEKLEQLKSGKPSEGGEAMDTDQGAPSVGDLRAILHNIDSEVSRFQALVAVEDDKFLRYKVENIRRKHNYLPLIMELLKLLAKEGSLVPLVEKGKETLQAKRSEESK